MQISNVLNPPIILCESIKSYFDSDFQPRKEDKTFRMAMVKEKDKDLQMFLTEEKYYNHCENLATNLYSYMINNDIPELLINGSEAISIDLRRGISFLQKPLSVVFGHVCLQEVYSLSEKVWPSLKKNIDPNLTTGIQPIDISGKAYKPKNLQWLLL